MTDVPGTQVFIDRALHTPLIPNTLILIWGRADYKDVFSKDHFVECAIA
jgi:hypothetical protein